MPVWLLYHNSQIIANVYNFQVVRSHWCHKPYTQQRITQYTERNVPSTYENRSETVLLLGEGSVDYEAEAASEVPQTDGELLRNISGHSFVSQQDESKAEASQKPQTAGTKMSADSFEERDLDRYETGRKCCQEYLRGRFEVRCHYKSGAKI